MTMAVILGVSALLSLACGGFAVRAAYLEGRRAALEQWAASLQKLNI